MVLGGIDSNGNVLRLPPFSNDNLYKGAKMEVEQGTWVRRSSGIVSLRPLMQCWLERSLEYCKCHGGEDNGWWYNERASLSILAAAAWSLERWCALEEYSTTKQGVIPAGERIPARYGQAGATCG